MSAGSGPPSKNRKTFSGCWSCRERKIKCDEARPSCGQCRKSSLECKGYGLRLQWIINQQLDSGLPGLANPRRNVAPDCHMPVLSWDKIDQILSTIGQHDPRHKPDSQENVQLFMECFGVFRGTGCEKNQFQPHEESNSPSIRVQNITDNSPSPAIEQTIENVSSLYPIHPLNSPVSEIEQVSLSNSITRLPSISSLGVNSQGHVPSSNRTGEGSDSLNYGNDWNNSPVQITEERNTPRLLLQYHDASGSSPSIFSEGRSISDSSSHIHILNLPLSPTLESSESCYLGKKEKFLMNYYAKRVVDLFCVIKNGTSPWKTIHLPKALNAVGEISVAGTTSSIRESLISSCLSISAFCLSNDSRLRQREDECLKWRKLAYDYRLNAIKLLRNAMEKDFYPKARVKYKDFLTTTLSMITIDVMSGETDTCGIHLDGALRLINHGQTWKRQYSSKAQCLHRIYFYLRAIFESTLPRDSRKRRRRHQLSSPTTEQDTSPQDVFCHDIVAKYSSWSSPSILDRDTDENIGSYESIYGVPYSLLFLLTKVVDLIYKLYDESFDGRIPFDFMDECDDLEHSIMDWPSNSNFPSQLPENQSSSAKIVHYHTVAFHNALIIYFAQHIRLVGHRFLQPHIRAVLDSMEMIEQIKVETNVIAAPLYWPAFIAGSEAFDVSLQARFRDWYENVKFYGVEALRTGISVLEEVWEAGPRRGGRVTSLWRDLVERSGQILMLS